MIAVWCGSSAWSFEEGSLRLRREDWSQSSVKAPTQTWLELENRQYFNSSLPSYPRGAKSDNSSVHLGLRDTGRLGHGFTSQIQFTNQYSATENWNYFDLHEAYVAWPRQSWGLSLGRKLELWSNIDRDWQLGLFQPRYSEDRLHPVEAGLTGLFVNAQSEPVRVSVGLLPIYIPDFGPHSELKDQHFSSRNPWFHAPVDQVLLGGTPTDIRYEVDVPPTRDIVLNPGIVSKIEYQHANYAARAGYAYKPINAMALGFPSDHQAVVGETETYMTIRIHPRIVYSRVVSLDQQYSQGRWLGSVSLVNDQPVDNRGPDNFTSQQLAPANIFSGRLRWQVDSGLRASQIYFGWVKVNGGEARETGRFAGKEALFESRFQFAEAYNLGINTEFRQFRNHPISLDGRVIYDRLQGGGAVMLASAYRWNQNWRGLLQLDFMGLLVSDAAVQNGFFSSYRANDNVSMGVAYVF